MRKTYSGASRGERGTMLITVTIIVFVIAGMSAFVLDRARRNMEQQADSSRKENADQVADSAVSLAMAELNNGLLDNFSTPGSLHGNSITITSANRGHITSDTGPEMLGHPEQDGLNNDDDTDAAGNPLIDEPGEDNPLEDPNDPQPGPTYEGGIFRVEIQEWSSTTPKIGALGIDEDQDGMVDETSTTGIDGVDNDGDGQVDEPKEQGPEVERMSEDGNRIFTLKVEAAYGNYTIEKIAFLHTDKSPTSPSVDYGLFSDGSLTVKPSKVGGPMDSYDSRKGSYSSQKSGDHAGENFGLGTNNNLTVKPNNDIYGDAKYGPDPGDSKTIKGNVSGSTTKLSQEEKYQKAKFPSAGPSAGDLTVSGTTTLGSGTYHFDNITQGGGGGGGGKGKGKGSGGGGDTLKVKGPATIVVDESFTTSSDFTLDADTSGGKVKIYVEEEIDLGPKTTITNNDPNDSAENMQVYLGRKGGKDGTFNAQPMWEMKGLLWAPKAEAQFKPKGSDGGELYGAAIAGDITKMQPNVSVHYDEALQDMTGLPGVKYTAYLTTSWITDKRGGPLKPK